MSEQPPNLPPEDDPSSGEQNDPYKASVPFMITSEMKRQLRTLGVAPAEYRKMTPEQAWGKINAAKDVESSSETEVGGMNPDAESEFSIGENEPVESVYSETEEHLTVEQQLARQKVIEFLNGRQKRELQNKKGNYEYKVAKYEALRAAAAIGDFESPVTILDSSGNVVTKAESVKEFLDNLLNELDGHVVKLVEAIDGGDESKKGQLDKAHKLFDVVEETSKTVDIAISSKGSESGDNQPKEHSPTDEKAEKNEQKSSSDDGGNKPPKQENHEAHNSRWLDPRFILELKEKYNKALSEHDEIRRNLHDETSEHYKNILKTQVIGRAIKDRIKRSEWLSGDGNLGPRRLERYFNPSKQYIYEEPSENLVKHIAILIDEPYESLQAKADEADKKFAEKHHTFNPGEKVVLVRGKSIDEGWAVDKITYTKGEEWVWISKGRDKRHLLASFLKAQQEAAPVSDEDKLKKLVKEMKPYFGGRAKIKVGDDQNAQVVWGRFAGLTTDGKVYLQYDHVVWDENKEPILKQNGEPKIETTQIKVDPETFYEWQKLKTNEEIEEENRQKAEELHQQKLERIDQIPENERLFQLGQEVLMTPGEDPNEPVTRGWIVEDMTKDDRGIWIKLFNGENHITINQKLLEVIQQVPEGQSAKEALDEFRKAQSTQTENESPTAEQPAAEAGGQEVPAEADDESEKERKREKLKSKIKDSWWDAHWKRQKQIDENIDKIKDEKVKKREKREEEKFPNQQVL